MAVFKCKMCGGELDIREGMSVAECQYCGTKQTLPKLDDDEKLNLYDRANHFRRNNEYDKAMSIYEKILELDRTDAEAYWSLVLCKYGIEYVDDPATHKRIPTVNRAQFTSIFDDGDYKSAIQYADGYQKSVYEDEANRINEIQKSILAISQNEKPFDVFICYKETDNQGRRTHDSVYAQDLYNNLVNEGYRVFFSRITLEDKLGVAYEPYIFAALNSSKVMVVIGTSPENFNAIWVKNEWSRFLTLVKKSNGKKILIPAYKDMDPYDLPEEFSHLQAQDMNKLGFMQDLLRGIKKLIKSNEPTVAVKETVVVNNTNAEISPLLKRAFMYLEDENWEDADNYCERVLDSDPENSEAYLGKLMAELHINTRDDLVKQVEPFDNNANYQKAIRFADSKSKEKLENVVKQIKYNKATKILESASTEDDFNSAIIIFKSILNYKDSTEKISECETEIKEVIYNSATDKLKSAFDSEDCIAAIKMFESISGYKDADEKIQECRNKTEEEKNLRLKREEDERIAQEKRKKRIKLFSIIAVAIVILAIALYFIITSIQSINAYNSAVELQNSGKIAEAIVEFERAGDYKDSKEILRPLYYEQGENALDSKDYKTAVRMFSAARGYKDSADLVRKLNIESISTGGMHVVGLKLDGTVVADGYNEYGQCDVGNWTDIVAVSAGGSHTVGLKSDGTVVAVGDNSYGQCNVENWTDIISISVAFDYTVGLKSDGTVVAVGNNNDGQCDIDDWTDIVAVSAGDWHTVGLKSDGTVVAVGRKFPYSGERNVDSWTDIVAVSAGNCYTVGLKSDGTVVAVGENEDGQCNVENWTDIIEIYAGDSHTIGLKSDGSLVAVGRNDDGECNLDNWSDIVAISAEGSNTLGLRSDGTVVAVGSYYPYEGNCDVNDWRNIKSTIKK